LKTIYIVAAKRTPLGRFMGGLAKRPAVQLAKDAAGEMLKKIPAADIDQVIVGNVLAAGQGMNISRQIGVGLGIPLDRTAYTVNMMCASGMQAMILAAQAILAGEANAVLCGGTESMSNAPYLLDQARGGYKLGNGVLMDAILRDGLTDTFSGKHMGLTAEALARKYGIDRKAQDAFALQSQQKYAAAQARRTFDDEIVSIEKVTQDEHPRTDVTMEKLASMKPAFQADGTVTPANASGINDGAAMLVVCDEATAGRKGWTPLARVAGWCSVGCDPAEMGLGPVHAVRKLCAKPGLELDSMETIELNEAFAAQALACMKELNLKAERVNPNGGAIALGHPIGATGARLLVHLTHRIARKEVGRALATLCVGGGMGSAVVLAAV
jgi:acetyl-CoA C-acetyltransferase